MRQGALLVQAAAGNNQLVNGLVAAERGLDGVLCRNVGAQAHGGEQVNAFQVAGSVLLRAGDSDPTRTVTADAVCLGQAGEGQAEHVVAGEGRHVDGLCAIVGNLFVNLIREHDQTVFACHIHNLLKHGTRVDGTGGVVRVNNHDSLGALGNLRLNVFDVRVPVVFLIAEVVHGLAADQRGGCGPQRVVGHGDQDFVAGLAQCLQGHRDQLRHTVTQVDRFGVEVHDAAVLVVVHNGGTCRVEAAGVRVALSFGQVTNDIHHDGIRRLKAEGCGVTNVQLEDAVAHRFHAIGFIQNRAADVVQDVAQL